MKNNYVTLNEEIVRIKSLFGDSRLYGNINEEKEDNISDVEEKLISLNESKVLLQEQAVNAKALKAGWKKLNDFLGFSAGAGFKKSLGLYINELAPKLRTSLEDAVESDFRLRNLDVPDLLGKQKYKDELVAHFQEKTISSNFNKTYGEFIDNLPDNVKNMEIEGIDIYGVRRIGRNADGSIPKVKVEDLLQQHRKDMTELYEEIEGEMAKRIDDPVSYNIHSKEDMERFAKDFEDTFGDDVPNANKYKEHMEGSYSRKNVPKEFDEGNWPNFLKKAEQDIKIAFREIAESPTTQKIITFF